MNEELIQIFSECIEAIEQERLSLDDCLDKYPQYRTELIDLLQVVMQARAVPRATPTAEFRRGARARLLSQLPPRTSASDGAVTHHQFSATTAITRCLQATGQRLAQRWPWPLRPSLAIGAALLLVCLFFIGIWLRDGGQSGEETKLTQDDRSTQTGTATPEDEREVVASDTPPVSKLVAEDNQEEPEAIATPNDTFSIYIPAVSSALDLNAQTAAIKVTQGLVEVQSADGAWTAINRVTTATSGQRVRTGAFSSANITFYDGSQATLGPNTEISLDQVDAQPPEDGFRTVVMTQWGGESEHSVAFRNDAGSRYEVMTPNGSGQARGTTFQVLVTAHLLTQFSVTEGRVDVTHLNVTVIVIAGQTSIIPPQQPPSEPRFTVSGEGEVTTVGETWIIGGQAFATTDSTIIVGNPQIGDIASVSGYLLPDGTLVATHIILRHRAPANQFVLTGVVESIGADEWIVAGQPIASNVETDIDERIAVGDMVRIHGLILADGTLLAERIDHIDDEHPFEFVGVVVSVGPDTWVISGVDIAVDENTEIKAEIAIGDVVKVEGIILADGTWLADEIKLEVEEARFEFTGRVNSISPWLVAGISFETDTFTEIDSGIDVGDLVYIEGQILADGTWLATEIRLLADETLTFTFIGIVDAIDPWIVSSLPLLVNENTLIDDDVAVGSLVRVRGVILADGTWLATLILRLDDDSDLIGCYTLTTMVIGISGNQLTLAGLPPITLNEDIVIVGDILPNTIITITVCVSQDETISIVSIVVVHHVPPPTPTPQPTLPPPPAPTLPPPPAPTLPPPSGGGAFDINDNNQNLTLTCNGHAVTVRGNDNTITLLGNCGSIVVRGNSNRIFYQAAASITNTGNNNTIQQR
jgi:ferric-dicitrate binding protein FerR (iron transport regulator)